jgi:chromosome segregation ATPase
LRFTNYTFALVDFDHHTAGKNEVLEMSDRLRLENSELEDKIEQLQHVRQQEEETVTKLMESVQVLENSIEELAAQEAVHRQELDSLGNQQEELAKEVATKEMQLQTYNDSNEKLERRVVRCSPRKLRKDVAEVQRMVKDAIAQIEGISLSTDSYLKLVNSLQKLSPMLRGVGDTHLAATKKEEQYLQRQSDLEAFRECLVREQRRSQELKQEIKAIVGRTERVEQRLHQLSVKHKKFDSTAAGRTFQRDRDILELEIKQMEKVKLQAALDTEHLQTKMAGMRSEFQKQLQAISSKREKVVNVCVSAHQATTMA